MYEPSLNPPEALYPTPDIDSMCAACKDELAAIGSAYCSPKCAFDAGVNEERARCYAICQELFDTKDSSNGHPTPNMAMEIAAEIREGA